MKCVLVFLFVGLLLVFVATLWFRNAQVVDDIEKGSSFFGYRNVRDYVKQNIRFECRPIKDGSHFAFLLVGCPSMPYTGDPALLIRLPDGTVVNTATIDVGNLKAKAKSITDLTGARFCDIGTPSMDLDENAKWPDGAQELQIYGCLFRVHSNRLIGFEIFYHDLKEEPYERINYGTIPAISRPGEVTMYQFPLKQSEVIRIFGKPDRIIDYLVP